jgi:hypothetical protein
MAARSAAASGISDLARSRSWSKTPTARPRAEPVEAALAGAAVFHQASVLQLRQVRGDGALAHGQNFLQFGDGKLLAAQQQQDAEPVGFGDDFEDFHNRGHSFRLTALLEF